MFLTYCPEHSTDVCTYTPGLYNASPRGAGGLFDFLVDEKLENYIQLYDWITSLGYPESLSQFSELQTDNRFFKDKQDGFQERSDGTLIILNSNFQEAGKIKFRDLFPTELTGIPFDATIEQQQYYTATAIFKYTMFDLIDDKGTKV